MRVAVSECLLGDPVRYDGSGAATAFPHSAVEGLFEYRGICPEVGIGLGTPRDPIHLVEQDGRVRVQGVHDPDLDVTEKLREFGRAQAAALGDVAGYVFMRGSPSCGAHGVKVQRRRDDGTLAAPERRGRGVFAAALMAALPELPVEENGRLHDPVLRACFVTRVFAYAHWRAFERAGISRAGLVAFHSRYKYLLMAHSVPHYQRAGRLLGNLRGDAAASARAYLELLMAGLAQPPGRRGHANVLSHLLGYLKRQLDGSERRDLDELIHAYRRGEQPLEAPLAALRARLRQHPDPYLDGQVYLEAAYSGG
ncbi:MAG: YbgA family protein [Pseudomonadota bacterium]